MNANPKAEDLPGRIRSARGIDVPYLLASVACLLFVAARHFSADFFDNEWVYSLGPIKFLRPSFLRGDAFLDLTSSTFIAYDLVLSPLYYLLDSWTATLLSRLAIWGLQVWALARLARSLGVSWWAFILLFATWLNVEQTLVAGEWIIGCASAKPIAYAFVFLALERCLARSWAWSGVFCGLATSLHVLVGGWSAMALLLAIVGTRRNPARLRDIGIFLLTGALFAAPGLLPALLGILENPGAEGSAESLSAAARVAVLLVNPFHQDPDYFMTGLERVKVPLFMVLAVLLLWRALPAEKAVPMNLFVGGVCAIFAAGLVARSVESYRFLNFYPFRVADALVPLAFWLGFVLLFQEYVRRLGRKGPLLFIGIPFVISGATYLIDRCEPQPRYGAGLRQALTALLRTEPRLTMYWLQVRFKEWQAHLSGRGTSDADAMASWIKQNTSEDSVILAPPWDSWVPLKSGRVQVVAFKIVPEVGPKIFEWKKRMEALNRGAFSGVGFEMLDELKESYAGLTADEVLRIGRAYDADYFLTPAGRFELELRHEAGGLRLYRLGDRLQASPSRTRPSTGTAAE